MAASVEIPTADLGDDIAIGHLAGYNMSESSVPTRVGDSDGATPQLTVAGVAGTRYRYANEQDAVFTADDGGQVFGTVSKTEYSMASGIVEYTIDTVLTRLNIEIQALPIWNRTHAQVFVYLTGLGGIESWDYDSDLDELPSSFAPGFVGNLWDNIKQWCAANGLETYIDNETAYLTRVGRFRMELTQEPDTTREEIDTSDHAASVDITNYNYRGVYNKTLWKADTVYSVGAGEVQEIRVAMEGTPSFVDQPEPLTSMIFTGNDKGSYYVVTGSDGYIVNPAFWSDNNGSIDVSISPDAADELIITIHGATDSSRAPYRISEGAADRPALWIAGHGLLRTPKVTNYLTGDISVVGEPLVIDSPYIGDTETMNNVAVEIAGHYSGPVHRLTIPGTPTVGLVREAFTRWSPVYQDAVTPRLSNEQASLGAASGIAYGWALGLNGLRPTVADTGGVLVTGTPSGSGVCLLRSMELSNAGILDFAAWSPVAKKMQWLIVPAGSATYTAKVTLTRNSGTQEPALKMRVLNYAGTGISIVQGVPYGGQFADATSYTGTTGTFTDGVSTSLTASGAIGPNQWAVLELVSTNGNAADFTVTAVQFVKGTSTTTVPPVTTPESVVPHFYGRVSGAMLRYGDDMYRVIGAGYSADAMDLTLEAYATIGDFNDAWAGELISDFNAGIPNLVSIQHASVPLAVIE